MEDYTFHLKDVLLGIGWGLVLAYWFDRMFNIYRRGGE